ncbi:MAG: CDP-diacylglycerol--glycerol-3-phosphate 3-phosphatidyltransferase [Oscillospiraceae bacterium]
MNTPNKLTILRVIMVPLFLLFLLMDFLPYHLVYALVVFVFASLTDLVDGHLARKNNQVTTFGKFLDPLADKVLVMSAMIYFVQIGYASAVAIIIILAREFLVTSLRLAAVSSDGKVIAASIMGKVKTVVQMVSIITILVLNAANQIVSITEFINIPLLANVLMWLSAVITVVSGLEYLIKNKSSINTTK